MRVGVIGTGHVGLVTAATLSSFGHEVSAVDSDAKRVDMLRRGEPRFFEPGLPELLDEQVAAGQLSFEHESEAVLHGPERHEDDPQVRRPDISLAGLDLGWEPKVPLETGLERVIAWASETWTT